MFRFLCVAFLLLVYPAPGKALAGELPTDVHPWQVYEFEMTAERELSSPYVDGLPEGGPGYVSVTFRGEKGEAEIGGARINGRSSWLLVPGPWSRCRWIIRNRPPASPFTFLDLMESSRSNNKK